MLFEDGVGSDPEQSESITFEGCVLGRGIKKVGNRLHSIQCHPDFIYNFLKNGSIK